MRRSNQNRLARLAALLSIWLTVSIAAAQDTAPATQQTAQEKETAETLKLRKEREEQLRNMPVARVSSLRDAVQFAIEKDDLVVRTSIPPTDMSAVVVDGSPTLVSVAAQRGDEAGAPYVPVYFALMRHEYPESGGIAITQINIVAPRVAISKSSEGGGEFRNVELIQSDEFLEEGDDRVRFYVQETRNDEQVADLKLSAANVTELRRKYPAETMRYLEPIFRDFGQAAVLFQVNVRAAWQVLGGSYTPPQDVAKRVDALLVKLDAESPQDREAALKDLEKLGQQAALVLMKRGRAGLSEEQQTRVETFLAPFKPLSDEEAAKMRDDTEFLLMTLSAEDAELAGRALERLKEVAKQPITFDVKATGQQRADAIAKLRAQLLPATTRPATTKTVIKPAVEAQ